MLKYVCSAALLMQSIVLSAQIVVTGTVKDLKDGRGLPGATVQVKESSLNVVTDETGWYRLENFPSGEHVLVVRFLGYQEKQVNVNTSESIVLDVSLEEAS